MGGRKGVRGGGANGEGRGRGEGGREGGRERGRDAYPGEKKLKGKLRFAAQNPTKSYVNKATELTRYDLGSNPCMAKHNTW